MIALEEFLKRSAALHSHICPRQVLGVRMGLLAAKLLGLELPQHDKRTLAIVESDGCFADGVAVATNCWVGRRTLRVEDFGKTAATFVDTKTGLAWRIAPHPGGRERASVYAPEARNRWEAMLLGYQRMPDVELLVAQRVTLRTPVAAIISRAGYRVACDRCGEEIINEREVRIGTALLCRSCAGQSYYCVASQGETPVEAAEQPEATSPFLHST
ncbi:MAG: FmdE family protein [Chloroflexota bacterium]|nr:FmdE family protein [Chloroflexota bacterium]